MSENGRGKSVREMEKYAFGIDVGGTTIKMGFFSSEGDLLDKWEIPTDTSDRGSHIISDLAVAVNEKLAASGCSRASVVGIGIGVPGPVSRAGYVLNCPNLGWGTFFLEEEITKQTGLYCKAGNDATVATLGEMYRGGAKNYQNLVMLTLGTGVGGGIVLDGKILPGTFGAAGEVGHMPVNDHETAICGCGKRGCLEQYASANGFVRVTKLCLAESGEDTLLRNCGKLTSKEIFDAAKAGDAFALRMVDNLGRTLGKACAVIAGVVDPEVFVFGGGVSRAGTILTDAVRSHYDRYVFRPGAVFVLAELGNDAGIYGGVKMVLDAKK